MVEKLSLTSEKKLRKINYTNYYLINWTFFRFFVEKSIFKMVRVVNTKLGLTDGFFLFFLRLLVK